MRADRSALRAEGLGQRLHELREKAEAVEECAPGGVAPERLAGVDVARDAFADHALHAPAIDAKECLQRRGLGKRRDLRAELDQALLMRLPDLPEPFPDHAA